MWLATEQMQYAQPLRRLPYPLPNPASLHRQFGRPTRIDQSPQETCTDASSIPKSQPESEVIFYRHVRIKRIVLKNHRNIALSGRETIDYASSDQDSASSQRFQTCNQTERRALAAPTRADQNQKLTISNPEVEFLHPKSKSVARAGANTGANTAIRAPSRRSPVIGCRFPDSPFKASRSDARTITLRNVFQDHIRHRTFAFALWLPRFG